MSDPLSSSPSTPVPAATATETTPAPAAAATAPAPLFDESGVTISASRIVTFGQPFPLKDATAARLAEDHPHLMIAIPVAIIGLLVGIYGGFAHSSPTMVIGFMVIVVGFLAWRFQSLRHRVFLVRESGDTEVLSVSDLGFAERVRHALATVLAGTRTGLPAQDAAPRAAATAAQ